MLHKKMNRISTNACLAVMLALPATASTNIEVPNYRIVSSESNIEIRQYAPMIIAEVEVTGTRKREALKGFKLLADYIFGNNTISENVSMTAPVTQQASRKIAMTAPVQQSPTATTEENWKVSFVMPAEYTKAALPTPNNQQVTIRQIDTKKHAVIRFSGWNSNNNVNKHKQQLVAYIQKRGLATVGEAQYAFYDSPWTLPPLRRNEIMFEIK